ncbi:alpha-2-macroglobulin family protein [Halpernia frigidisoli]|uniref:Alpha-2-macroglobulin family protein n=1 Tax=Halpernia frigidisoli TaxID=1125876 RepID=A0A1I3E9U9_9FLAO|nr:MG2 domain-containing protein [Halpernia frigidisoli]SFH95734.1 Alpha-2-macroglobulin family protein [Halpernia frigidisoli]
MKLLTKLVAVLILTLTFYQISAQEKYDLQWKKVQDNYQKGLYKSNLPLILDIQKLAMKDNNAVQLIRSLKAEFSIVKQTQDDTKNNSASLFFKKLQEVKPSLKGADEMVFNVLLGEFFQDYFNQNQWKINQRTNLNSQDFSQIETWSKLDFKNYLSKFYQDFDKQQNSLEKISLKPYKNIFSETEDLEFFPTLADWNSSNKIEFLQNSSFFTKYELDLNNVEILKIYDQLIAQNLGNTKLYFQHQKLNYSCGFNQCKDRLQQLETLYNSNESGDYKVLISQEIIQNYEDKEDFKTALRWIDKVEKQFPKSKYLSNIQNQKNSILQPSLTFKYEKTSQSEKPIHVVASAKNVEEFSLNIYEVKSDFYNFLKFNQREYDKNLFGQVQKTLIRKDKFSLPKSDDHKNHSTSLELKSLPPGIYLVDYVVNKEIVEHFSFIVSNSRLIYQNKNEELFSANTLKLVSRENGEEVKNHPLEIYQIQDNQKIVKSEVSTNSTGQFKFLNSKTDDYYRTYLVRDAKTNDFNLLQVYGNNRNQDKSTDPEFKTQIFLDRAIYRPGQIVYFKVINTKLDKGKEAVAANLKQKITLEDANGDEVSNQTFTTNDFGSYNGSFTLPNGKLNGEFTLNVEGEDEDGRKDFQVEEYKRPKFEVTFEPIKGEYKYGQTVELKGKAMMFSGVALSNSTVNYEIKKQNIRWRYFSWFPRGNDNENSILGEVKTNEKGEFTIKIDLKKDEKIDGIQIDNYAVNASVTDINGETQSANENFKVSSISHYINVADIPDTFSDEDLKLKVETKNYNDQVLQKSYHLKLSKLTSENRVIRDNFKNDIQDLPVFSKEEFVAKFPHDYFSKEEKKDRVEKVLVERIQEPRTKNQDEKANSNLDSNILNLGSLKAGKYKLELYNIEGKDSIKTEKTFEVFDKKSLSDLQKPFLKVIQPKAEFQRNEKAKIFVYSAIPDTLVNVFVQNGKGDTFTEQKKFKNGVLEYNVDFPKDESIKQMNVQFQLVAFNDVQTESVNLNIASDKKPLRIETVTFRDKIEPGQKEKWTVRVLGDDKEKINAEVLANMYDMSLDKFAVNSYYWQSLQNDYFRMSNYGINEGLSQENYSKRIPYLNNYNIEKPGFNWFDGWLMFRDYAMEQERKVSAPMALRALSGQVAGLNVQKDSVNSKSIDDVVVVGYNSLKKKNIENLDNIPVRQNLNETAFFYPNLMTDKDGNVSFEFTSPEALAQWKLMFLAHTKDARSATLEKSVVTQKEFSVTPNYPRFLREGDELQLQSKLSSLVDKPLNGTAQLQILDAFTNEDISSKFNLNNIQKSFDLKENGNSVVNWTIKVPNNVSSIILKVVAKAGDFSDGEQKAIAVLPNRMLVTDAVPIFVKEGQTKTFSIENLTKNNSTTIQNFSNTLELTTNPIWEIMFALPSLKNDQNNSADVVFNKWFADVLASEIFKANPKLKTVFDEYQSKGLLKSNLDKNQELKQLLLEETPWVLESKNEEDQMAKIARLFDANTMKNSINDDWSELQKLQNPDGGFSWYSGYPSSYSTSLYILKSLGRINVWLKGNVKDYQSSEQKEMVSKLVKYVDSEVVRYGEIDKNVVNNYVLDYLDTRNYWEKDFPLKQKGTALKNAVILKAKTEKITDFTFVGLHRLAILFDDYGLKDISKKFLTYLKETSTESETHGIYWKQNLNDWGWFSSKVVNQAGALEAFNKLVPIDEKMIEEMKIWLITQKEVNSWGSSRGTAEVIFTILNSGKSWTSSDSDKATIIWGGKTLENPDVKATGYMKSTLKSDVLDKKLGTVTITKPGARIVQGGLFWQYYEDLGKIKSSESYISITKELYKKVKTVNGEELQKIDGNSPLKIGDKVTVRMILNTDRSMEFIHLKDMRAAGFEPLNVISGYEYKNNLGYYQSTKDASTNFYIQYMPKGKYVFEYDYVCNAAGKFSNGITTLQNYYAPQMNAHTQGTSVEIKE